MGLNFKTLAAARSFTKETVEGNGALKGKDGESAYQIALDNGFVGSQEEWLTSLKGKSGSNGADGFSPIITPDVKNTDDVYKLNITTVEGMFKTENLKGEPGKQGIQGIQGERGETGKQGIQGIKGEKGNDGYPFLIYKEYETIDEFKASDFPEIGLMFMVKTQDEENSFPVYRYTGEGDTPYSYITGLSAGEAIKGDKGDKGDKGEQGVSGVDGRDGTTYTPQIGNVTKGDEPSVNVEIDKETGIAKFNFILPKGDKGDTGSKGNTGERGQDGDTPYIKNNTWWYGNTDSGVPIPNIEDVLDYVDKTNGFSDTPVGHILTHMGNNPPKHYLICDGSEYTIGTYPYLEKFFIQEFGFVNKFGGDGETTFAVPNLQGEFLRGSGENGHEGSGSGAEVGEHQDATKIPNVLSGSNRLSIYTTTSLQNTDTATNNETLKYTTVSSNTSSKYPTHYTSRPTNTSVLYCIKYEPTYYMQGLGSAYDIASVHGFNGTESEWIASLKGEKGESGITYTPEIGEIKVNNIINNEVSVSVDIVDNRAIFNFTLPRIDPIYYIDKQDGIDDTPVGHILSYMGKKVPKHYLICDGSEYEIDKYPYLAAHIKEEFENVAYFGGDGINTFAVPDLRGEFLRGFGTNKRNTGSGGEVGEHQDSTEFPFFRSIYSTKIVGSRGNINNTPKNIDMNIDPSSYYINSSAGNVGTDNNNQPTKFTARPTNTSVLYCIKYEPTYYMIINKQD